MSANTGNSTTTMYETLSNQGTYRHSIPLSDLRTPTRKIRRIGGFAVNNTMRPNEAKKAV
jgi:hypothetical protein